MTPMTTLEPVEVAALEHIALRDHRIHPEGHWDGSRFWLAEHELQPCCAGLAEPTWRWPYRQMSHARTAEHVAERHGVDLRALRSTARRLRRMGLGRHSPGDAASILRAAGS